MLSAFRIYKTTYAKVPRPADRRCARGALRADTGGAERQGSDSLDLSMCSVEVLTGKQNKIASPLQSKKHRIKRAGYKKTQLSS
jgi:hypothetical protein